MKTLSTITIAAAALLIGSSAALAVPTVNFGPKTLNQNFDGSISFGAAGLDSSAGEGNFEMLYTDLLGGTGATIGDNIAPVVITEHPAWADAQTGVAGGADWISFANTGVGAGALSPDNRGVPNGPGLAIATFTLDFTVGDLNGHGALGLWIYGDDTAEVFISGGDIFGGGAESGNESAHGFDDGVDDDRQRISILANTSQSTCAAGSIGCQPGEFGFVEMLNLSDNTTYTLEIDMFQIGGGPAGIMFAGGVGTVPEPASMALLGLGLVGMGAAVRRRRQKA